MCYGHYRAMCWQKCPNSRSLDWLQRIICQNIGPAITCPCMATHMSCTRAILVCILALLATWASCNYSGVQFLDHTFLHVLLPTTPVSCTTLPLTCDVSAPCWYAFHTCFYSRWNSRLELSMAMPGPSCGRCVVDITISFPCTLCLLMVMLE